MSSSEIIDQFSSVIEAAILVLQLRKQYHQIRSVSEFNADEMQMTYELIYPSGHRQVWTHIETASGEQPFFHCITLSPDGDPLECRILSAEQLRRTARRVLKMGGVCNKSAGPTKLEETAQLDGPCTT